MEVDILRNIKKGPYIEFNMDGNQQGYTYWSDNSLFLDDMVFGIFWDAFEVSVQNFNYNGPTLYEGRALDKLISELEKLNQIWMTIDSAEIYLKTLSLYRHSKSFVLEFEKGGKSVAAEWRHLLAGYQKINSSLLDIFRKCKLENKVLWVLGV